MTDTTNFSNLTEFTNYITNNRPVFILVGHYHVENYEGMVLCIILRFESNTQKCRLQLEWMSLGLDLYGDTLQESYQYEFESTNSLLQYISKKYNISVTDIPVKYKFESDKFPNPIYHSDRKQEFEEAWQRFLIDFKKGNFLDTELKLVYNSMEKSNRDH